MKIRTVVDDLRWPNRCAKCGSTEQLKLTTTKFRNTLLTSYLVVAVINTETLTLPYPICRSHSFATGLASFVMSTSAFAKIIRVLFYFIFLTTMFALVKGFMEHQLKPHRAIPILITLIVGMATIVWSRKWLPVRPTKLDEGILDLVFSNDEYAQEFVSLNPEHTNPEVTRRSPWNHKKNWGTIGFYALIVIGFVWLVAAALRTG